MPTVPIKSVNPWYKEIYEVIPRHPEKRTLGFYFASKSCPLCKPATEIVKGLIKYAADNRSALHIIYISSDDTETEFKEMVSTLKPSNKNSSEFFSYIPFSDEEKRTKMKKLYRACAPKEAAKVGLFVDGDKLYKRIEPSLVCVSRYTLGILTSAAISHVKMWGAEESTILWSRWAFDQEAKDPEKEKKDKKPPQATGTYFDDMPVPEEWKKLEEEEGETSTALVQQ